MSDETTESMDFDRSSDVPPDKPVPAGFYEGVVAGVQIEGPSGDRPDSLYPDCTIARVTYRLDENPDPDLTGKRVQSFPMAVRGHRDSWKWFDWCQRMGYDTKQPFRFSVDDVEGVRVSLKFDAPRAGKGKNEGKLYDNLVEVGRLS